MYRVSNMTAQQFSNKRTRTPAEDAILPPLKVPRIHEHQGQVNYLARQNEENLPIITTNEALPEVLRLVEEYDGVLQRQESLASNLGSCPLGPILLKRFERLFDGPPRILKSHAKDSAVTWLDVVEFAQNKPDQFNLEKQRNGVRVCQFYTKQCRVEISEEDFVLITSGMPQKFIPPQPIREDEQKELEMMTILDNRLSQVVQMANQVSVRTTQFLQKMKSRKATILDRDKTADSSKHRSLRSTTPLLSATDCNRFDTHFGRQLEEPPSPSLGFRAVNIDESSDFNDNGQVSDRGQVSNSATTPSITMFNGITRKELSPNRASEHIKNFLTPSEREAGLTEHTVRRSSFGTIRRSSLHAITKVTRTQTNPTEIIEISDAPRRSSSSVAIPHTPASLIPQVKTSGFQRDDDSPLRTDIMNRLESIDRGDRIIPPCDRCRRLQMDCLKNLTACSGCTKKHAKCSWRDVRSEELQTNTTMTPVRDQDFDMARKYDENPTSAGSTIEVYSVLKDVRSTKSPNSVNKRTDHHLANVAGNITTPSSEPRSRSIDATERQARFDLRPPPLGHTSHEQVNHQSPPQISRSLSYSHSNARHGHGRHDDGDRLEALASQVYRSASQNAK